MSKKILIKHFGITYWIMEQQTAGLSHEDSVLQPAMRGNCMNWVLGHILESRERILGMLNQETLMTEDEIIYYKRGSEPVTNGEDCVDFERLLTILHESQIRILAGLDAVTDDTLAEVIDPDADKPETLDERLAFMHWHETYHTGQLEYLRQLAGTDDSIIP